MEVAQRIPEQHPQNLRFQEELPEILCKSALLGRGEGVCQEMALQQCDEEPLCEFVNGPSLPTRMGTHPGVAHIPAQAKAKKGPLWKQARFPVRIINSALCCLQH